MIHFFNVGAPIELPVYSGVLELDFDPAAERYVVQHRETMETLWNGPVPTANPARLRLPLQYTTEFNLMVLTLDDAGSPSYYVAGNDKVQAQLVDARFITLNP